MTPKTKRISDSIVLRTVTTEKFKTGMLALSVSMPRGKYTSAYNFLLSGILRRGTVRYPTMASLNRRLDELYAATVEVKSVKYGRNETFLITAELLDDSYSDDGTDIADGVLEIISELLLHPKLSDDALFPSESLEPEKRIAADSLRAIINNPRSYASLRASEIMNRDEPEQMGLDATISAVEAVDRETITKYWRDELAKRPIDIFYVGSLTEDELETRILSHFGSHNAEYRDAPLPPTPKLLPRESVSVEETMPVSQGKLSFGFRTGVCVNSDDYYALVLMSEIFGGSPASKLFMNVREGMSLCYYCSSSYNMYTGTLTVSSGIECSDRDRAQTAILKELDDVKRGNISDTEFSAAQRSLKNWYRQIYDNPFDLHAFYAGRELFSINSSVEECREKLLSVTREDVIRAAQNIELDTAYFLCGTAAGTEEADDE